MATWIAAYDVHYPVYHKPTWNAILEFIKRNPVAGFIFGGDQLDNQDISHHTKGKPGLRERAGFKRAEVGFERDILTPIEKALPKGAKKVWIIGNHDDWEQQVVEEHPELEGVLDRPRTLRLEERNWTVIPLGHAYKLGKLNVIHGEILTGVGNQAGTYPSRKAVELFAGSVLAGHTHAPQSFTKVAPVEKVQKWQGHIAPIVGNCNPQYLRNRPTAWLNGFVVIETRPNGDFNLFPIVVADGKFSYGGKVYGR